MLTYSSAWGRVCLNLIPAQPSSRFGILLQAAILIRTSGGTEICEEDKTWKAGCGTGPLCGSSSDIKTILGRRLRKEKISQSHFPLIAKVALLQSAPMSVFAFCEIVCYCVIIHNQWITNVSLFFFYLAQCKRLEGGLDKLKEASVQLVELNQKLAEQRIVLAEKSAACEALLKEISTNTEVGR